ncbi:MAG: hypothetical protein JSV89_18395 [Spirochaetaceae bacterium]|nr:MAG: hypothetical protein JSV89_18395 [Spirochaetaceae bacterium]
MKKKKSDLLRLIAELDSDASLLESLAYKNRKAWQRIEQGSNEELDWAALGYTIHNIYNLLENYFLRISKFFENSLDPLSWHRALIEHMSLELEGIRPALLNRDLAIRIDELRSFRHIFRNIYQSELDPKRVELVQGRLGATLSAFKKAHIEFQKKIKSIAVRIED